ncbi:MAG TPA: signal peptide peptidase SppA [Burkholderiaceae bacterium]|nr:signal peptide peptidase SppA [Burkholderiaceae bacterium]
MSESSPGIVRRVFRFVFRWIDGLRRLVLNVVFLAVAAAILMVVFSDGVPHLAPRSALVLELRGALVEQASGTLGERFRGQLQGRFEHEVQLRDVVEALEAAAADPRIERVLLRLDEFVGAGMPMLREVANALGRVKAAGKQVIAWGSSYDQRQYFLAAHADEVYLHPMGVVYVQGFGGLRNYYKDALDRLGIQANVFRVGQFKNAAESFTDNGPSQATQVADAALYHGLWGLWTAQVEKARKLPEGSIDALINEAPQRLAAAHGDAARMVLEAKWVDGLKTWDELKQLLIERGALDEATKSFRQISLEMYLARQPPQFVGPAVGVVVAQGEISDGEEAPGRIGGRSTARLIAQAREDDSVRALVLRVDSPGGSVLGSELVRRELELTRDAGKPVVVSMGDLAASGGYWIALAADELIADAGTITGSIGVIALLPTAKTAMDQLSLHTGGYATTWLVNAYDPRTGIDPRLASMVQLGVERTYAQFLDRVAEARETSVEQVDQVAQGRVWTGAQALQYGLVDRLGGLMDAVQSAATRAQLGDTYRVRYIEQSFSPYAQLIEWLGVRALRPLVGVFGGQWAWGVDAAMPPQAREAIERDLSWASTSVRQSASGRRPYLGMVHCLCAAP